MHLQKRLSILSGTYQVLSKWQAFAFIAPGLGLSLVEILGSPSVGM